MFARSAQRWCALGLTLAELTNQSVCRHTSATWSRWTWHPIDPIAPDSWFGSQLAVSRLQHTTSFGFCTDPSPEHARLSRYEAIRMRNLRPPRPLSQCTATRSVSGEMELSAKRVSRIFGPRAALLLTAQPWPPWCSPACVKFVRETEAKFCITCMQAWLVAV